MKKSLNLKRFKKLKADDFDPIKTEPCQSPRIRNKITVKQVLLTWLSLMTVASTYDLIKLTPGIHVYQKKKQHLNKGN